MNHKPWKAEYHVPLLFLSAIAPNKAYLSSKKWGGLAEAKESCILRHWASN